MRYLAGCARKCHVVPTHDCVVSYIGADSNIHELYMLQSDYSNGSMAFNQHAVGGGGAVYH
jgi:hypothetical protein